MWCAFTIKKEKPKDGVTNVYVAATINKERIRFALKHYVKVENWDAGHSGLKAKVLESKETNAYLEQVKFTITTYYTTINYRSPAKRSLGLCSKQCSLVKKQTKPIPLVN